MSRRTIVVSLLRSRGDSLGMYPAGDSEVMPTLIAPSSNSCTYVEETYA